MQQLKSISISLGIPSSPGKNLNQLRHAGHDLENIKAYGQQGNCAAKFYNMASII